MTETDLRIPGRGRLNYHFTRNYRSQFNYAGRLGVGWQDNYDQRIENRFGVIVVYNGGVRADSFESIDGVHYAAPQDIYRTLTRNSDNTFTLRDPYGTQTIYHPLDNSAAAGRLQRIIDAHGNQMSFHYDTGGNMTMVVDPLGRTIRYVYDSADRISHIEDFSGRRVQFSYDEHNNLVSVTSPSVTNTPHGNDFPNGKTWVYTYSSGFSNAELNHNLIDIIAPNEVADGSMTPRVRNVYGTSWPETDRVIRQEWGGTNSSGVPAGGTVEAVYESVFVQGVDEHNHISWRTTVTDRSGNETVYEYNFRGYLLRKRVLSNRDVRPGDPAAWEINNVVNADGRVIRSTDANGNVFSTSYNTDSSNRLQHSMVSRVAKQVDPARGGDQQTITRSMTHEPIFNRLRSETDPRGHDANYEPPNGGAISAERYTTHYTFDYEEACDFAAIGAKIGISAAATQQRLADAGMCLQPLGDINGDGITNQTLGNVIRTEFPTVTLLPDSDQADIEGDTQQERVELYTFNQFGQMTRKVDAEGNVSVYLYHPERDPNGDGVVDNPSGDAQTGGYLAQIIEDAESGAARNSGTDPTPANIRNTYRYDAVGNVIKEVDGRGIATHYVVNELNQIVQTTRAAAHNVHLPEPAEPSGILVDFHYVERTAYDANNNVVMRQVEDRGNTSAVDGNPPVGIVPAAMPDPDPAGGLAFVDTVYQYDILDNRIEEYVEVANGTTPHLLRTSTRFDPNENKVWVVEPAGNAQSYYYDERGLLYQYTLGATTTPPLVLTGGGLSSPDVRGGTPATTWYRYDNNRNLVELCDSADTDTSLANNCSMAGGGDRTRYTYDGFNRRPSIVDSVGNQTVFQYDPLGQVVREVKVGPVGGASPTSDGPAQLAAPVSSLGVIEAGNLVSTNLLAATETLYDERQRVFQTNRALFVNTIGTTRSADVADGASELGKLNLTPNDDCAVPGLNAPPSGYLGCVTNRTDYDRNERSTFQIEDDGDTLRVFYDGAGRVIKQVDSEGNRTELAYDDNGNVIEMREVEIAQAAGVPSEQFLTTIFYDALNRLQRIVDNLGHTTDMRYDSRGNQVAMADAQGPMNGESITRRAFADGANTVNTINSFGNVTLTTYDGLSRVIRQDIVLTASGSGDGVNMGATLEGVRTTSPTADPAQAGGDGLITVLKLWDANSLLLRLTDDNGNSTEYAYDNLNRQLSETKGICDTCSSPTTILTEYDQDHNVILKVDENGTIVRTSYDAVNRRIAEAIERGASVVGTTATTFEYNGLSQVTGSTDNNNPDDPDDDSAIAFAYDSLGRVVEESQQVGAMPPQAISSAWRGDDLRYTLTYPNGRVLTYTYDLLDRVTSISDDAPPVPPIDEVLLDFDGWHLVSVPLDPTDRSTEVVLGSISADLSSAFAYTGCGVDEWTQFNPDLPSNFNTLDEVDPTIGLWVRMETPNTLEIDGALLADPEIGLCTGWNLVGYPSLEIRPIADVINSISSDVEAIFAYERTASGGAWQLYDPTLPAAFNDLQNFEPGRGYWFKMKQDATWTPPTGNVPPTTGSDPLATYSYIGSQQRMLERTHRNGSRMTYLNDAGDAASGYDGGRRPVQLRHLRDDNSLLVGFEHSYDRRNNKLNETKLHHLMNSEQYQYDSAYRLVSFNRPNAQAQPLHSDFQLDGVGNWQQVDDEVRQHSEFNELVQIGDQAISYDPNGNVIANGLHVYTYDYRNRLRTVSRQDDGRLIALYSYDSQGRRVHKAVTSAATEEAVVHLPTTVVTQREVGVWQTTFMQGGVVLAASSLLIALGMSLIVQHNSTWEHRHRWLRSRSAIVLLVIAVIQPFTPMLHVEAAQPHAATVAQTAPANSHLEAGETYFFYDGIQSIEEQSLTTTVQQQYVFGSLYIDEVVQLDRNLDDDATATGSGDQALTYHQNTLYSVYALTDVVQRIVEGYQYDAYGQQTVFEAGDDGIVTFGDDDIISSEFADSAVGNPFLFTGRRYDAESGNYFYRARMYSTQMGRFLQRDPLGYIDGLNIYQYVHSNPANVRDPHGTNALVVVLIVLIIAGAVMYITTQGTNSSVQSEAIDAYAGIVSDFTSMAETYKRGCEEHASQNLRECASRCAELGVDLNSALTPVTASDTMSMSSELTLGNQSGIDLDVSLPGGEDGTGTVLVGGDNTVQMQINAEIASDTICGDRCTDCCAD